MSSSTIALIAITLGAAIVNGAIGYGFSSITVPLALFIVASRVLNPALVLVELVLNAYMLWVNRAGLPSVWRRALPIMIGLAPGVAIGTALLAHVNPAWLKLATFSVLLPLILLQLAGYRRAIRAEGFAGGSLGAGVGALYATTTISGPPLALFLNNQGFASQEFRCALSLIRFEESALTAVAYATTGLFSAASVSTLTVVVPGVVIGVPLGAWVIRHMRADTFRRVCMAFDAVVVAIALTKQVTTLTSAS